MKLHKHLSNHWPFYALLIIAVLARLLFLFDDHEIWWDAGVYYGMAKYVWSGGTAGLWEHIRPVLWPLVLGAAWWFKLNIEWVARILEVVSVLLSTALLYMLGQKWFSRRAALFASSIWAFSSIVFYLGFHAYTELPAITLVLAALVAAVSRRWFMTGMFVSLAFLMKFPASIFIIVLGLYLVMQHKWKALIPLSIGYALPTSAFLMFNYAMYGSMLEPLRAAHESILQVLGCNVLRYNQWYQYFSWIVFDNVLNVLAVFGLVIAARRWKKQFMLPVLALVIPVMYFMQLHCREYRYLVLFLPFVALFTGSGLDVVVSWCERTLKRKRAVIAPIVVILIVGVSLAHSISFYYSNEPRTPDLAAEHYYRWLEDKQVSGEVWSSNPIISVYTDVPVNKIYYPIFEQHRAADFNAYLAANATRISAVFLDNCGGGIICPPDDSGCVEAFEKMRTLLNENFRQVFFEQSGQCWYAIYSAFIYSN